MARSTEEVWLHHIDALANGDFASLMDDYADDAVLMTLNDTCSGKGEIQQWFVSTITANPNLKLTHAAHSVYGDNVLATWTGESDVGTIPHGADTFVIRDDRIRLQTIWFTMIPK